MTDGPAGFVVMGVVAILIFCALIGVMVWAYSSQSAKRRKNMVESSTKVRK